MIGIDAYFPLTTGPQDTTYNAQNVINGWTSGEGYDYVYIDDTRTTTTSVAPQYAWKNIAWFWSNSHINPDSTTTSWVPESKKIWFTEFGFPSVDSATNQPNIFYDPASTDSGFPYFSQGRVDIRAQRCGITATLAQWAGSSMIERLFLWTWDARPYPYFPDLTSVWADGPDWETGHWVEGKFGLSILAAVVADLARRVGLQDSDIDVSAITDPVLGYALTSQQSVRTAVTRLALAYFFDVAESGGVLKFVPRGAASAVTIPEDDLIPAAAKNQPETLLASTRQQEVELPQRVNVVYLNPANDYLPNTQYSERQVTASLDVETLDLSLVFDDQTAKNIADQTLYSTWAARTAYGFRAGMKYALVDPADVITVNAGGMDHVMRVTSVSLGAPGIVEIEAVSEEVAAYDVYTAPGSGSAPASVFTPLSSTTCALMDTAALPSDDPTQGVLRAAACGASGGWRGGVLYRSDDGGSTYNPELPLPSAATMGVAITALAAGPTAVFDGVNTVDVVLTTGTLSSASELAVLNGAHPALLGSEIIQFATATLVSPGKYTLSVLLRGRQGTEWAMGSHVVGENFTLLNGLVAADTVPHGLLGLPRPYKAVSVGGTLGAVSAQDFTYGGAALKPYAPVSITGTRDGSGNLTINWLRRTRVSGQWLDGADVPLNEASEAYEVDILNGSTVVRTISGLTSPAATYSAAQQTTDFGSVQSSVSVRVYQFSTVVGRGYAGDGAV